MAGTLDAYRDVRDNAAETWFHAIYGSPFLQALVGLRASDESQHGRPGDDPAHSMLVAQKIEELRQRITDGGPREAVIRALLYVRMPDGVVDARGFNLLRRMREETGKGLNLATFKQIVREQFLMLLLDERSAVDAIPMMLATDRDLASRGKFDRMIELVGVHSKTARTRLAEVEALFEGEEVPPLAAQQAAARSTLPSARNAKPH